MHIKMLSQGFESCSQIHNTKLLSYCTKTVTECLVDNNICIVNEKNTPKSGCSQSFFITRQRPRQNIRGKGRDKAATAKIEARPR